MLVPLILSHISSLPKNQGIAVLHFKGYIVISEWDDYIFARKSGIKVKWKPVLAERLKYISGLEDKKKKDYLLNLCHYYFDLDKNEIPIQHPEIWNSILEIWKEELSWDDEKYLYWIVKALSFSGGSFKNAYLLLNKDSSDILRRIIELNSDHFEAKKLLLKDNLYVLDFAMHSIDSGMLINRDAGVEVITESEALLAGEPRLKSITSTFGGSLEYYKNRFLAWYEFKKEDTDLDFDDWYEQKM